jgi:hypothetical protein
LVHSVPNHCMNIPRINLKVGDEEGKRRLIADIAYLSAERRGFSPGYELDDWLQAEQEVEASMEAIAPSALDIGHDTDTRLASKSHPKRSKLT